MIMASHQQTYDYIPENHTYLEQNSYNQIQPTLTYDALNLQQQQQQHQQQQQQNQNQNQQQIPPLQQLNQQPLIQQTNLMQLLQPYSQPNRPQPRFSVSQQAGSLGHVVHPLMPQNQPLHIFQNLNPQQYPSINQTPVQLGTQSTQDIYDLQVNQNRLLSHPLFLQLPPQQPPQPNLTSQQQALFSAQPPHTYYNGHYYPPVHDYPLKSPTAEETLPPNQPRPNKPRIATTYWEDEKTICYQVEARGVLVSRRQDTDYVNGTKLLNVAGMSRGKRDGILKTERTKNVVRIGAMRLKGVWIPFERAAEIARNEGVDTLLYPLFVDNIKDFFEHKGSKLKNWDPQKDRRDTKFPTDQENA